MNSSGIDFARNFAQRLSEQLEQFSGKLPDRPVEFPGLEAFFTTGASLAAACGLIYPSDRYGNAIRSNLYENAVRREQFAIEIAALVNVSFSEAIEFCDSSGYTFEFIRVALQAGARLDKEDIKRIMEERARYMLDREVDSKLSEIIRATAFQRDCTFIVTLPNNDRREVEAAYMEVDGSTLYFKDEDHETILAFGPGHWVWAERVKDDDQDP